MKKLTEWFGPKKTLSRVDREFKRRELSHELRNEPGGYARKPRSQMRGVDPDYQKNLEKLSQGLMKKEEVEQVDELKKETLKSYVSKAVDSARTMPGYGTNAEKSKKTMRLAGVSRATEKLAKEEVEQIEENDFLKGVKKRVLQRKADNYARYAKQDAAKGRKASADLYDKMSKHAAMKANEEVSVVEGSESEQDHHDRMHRLAAGYHGMDPQRRARMEKIPGWKDQYHQALSYVEKHPKKDKQGVAEAVAIQSFKSFTEEMAVHPKAVHVVHVGGGKYKVHAVGSKFADGIKVGEHLTDTHLDDIQDMVA